MTIYAIDPGNEQSALVAFDGLAVTNHETLSNQQLLEELRAHVHRPGDVLVVEQIASFGMPVGAEVFETVFWSGRFVQTWEEGAARFPWSRVKRLEVKVALCHDSRAKDANIRQALIDRFGGKAKAIGRKAAPGPLYGIHGDEWSALAVAVTWWDRQQMKGRVA